MKLDREYSNLLIDYYGNLLTKHQLQILNDYFKEDLSMNEISINYKISKSAVSDLINRTINQLLSYEKALKLIEQNKKLDKIIYELENKDAYSKNIAKKLTNIFRR